jgi:hypothetical protein
MAARSNEAVARAGDQRSPGLASPSSIHAGQASSFSDVFAVVVGISDYPGLLNDLSYCDDDAFDMYSWLQTQFNVPSTHITMLQDSSATPAAITSAIEDFASMMDGDDYLLFSYSGHGSYSVSPATITVTWNVASDHYYANNYDNYWHYNYPGADLMRVHFTQVETEKGFDNVYVGDYNFPSIDDEYFSGSYTDLWSSWIPTDDLYVRLSTDISNTYWGFQVDSVQIGSFCSPFYINPYEPDLAGMSGGQIDALLDNVPGKAVVILDSCMSGGVAAEIMATDRYTAAACTYNEISTEDDSIGNGVFTYEFIDAWNCATDSNLDGAVSFEEAFPIASAGTVSRSTGLFSPHHPVQVDNMTDDVIFSPNAVLGAVSENGSHGLSFNFTHSGVGLADLIVAYYDAGAHDYRIAHNSVGRIGQGGSQWLNVSAPGSFTVNGYSLSLKASFYGASETRSSFRQDAGSFTVSDSDLDGWNDMWEFEHAMNPWSTDSDGDGFGDWQEVNLGLSPIVDDLDRDSDGDFMTNRWEIQHGLDPCALTLYSDQDSDGLMDWQEFRYGGDPLVPDTDGDGLNDGLEFSLGFDLLDPDMDSDGFPDGVEYYLGNNPQNPNDTPWLHVVAIAVVVGVPILIAFVSKRKGKARRPAPPGPRPSEKTNVKQASSPVPAIQASRSGPVGYTAGSGYPTLGAYPPAAPAPSGTVTYASYSPGPRYSAQTTPAPAIAPPTQPSPHVRGQITELPPLAPDIQRQLDSMPPDQRETVKQMILQKINERIAQSSPASEPVQAPSPGGRFCIHCGTMLAGSRCGNCGWDSGENI